MMTREELQALSIAELIDLCLQLQAQVEQLQTRVSGLEQRLGPSKTSRNSSIPPSKSEKSNPPLVLRCERPKRGSKVGHVGHARPFAPPDCIVERRVEKCARCGHDLQSTEQKLHSRHQQVELPEIRPVVTEVRCYATTCPQCGTEQHGTYPPGLEPSHLFGPHLEALTTYLREQHHISEERIEELLEDVFHVASSQGGLDHTKQRALAVLTPAAETIRQELQQSAVIGSDETSTRINGQRQWEWVFQTPTLSYYTVAPKRDANVITQVMAQACPRAWVSDLGAAQLKAPAEAHQVCLEHQRRDLEYVIESEHSRWAYELQRLFQRARRLNQWRAGLSPEIFQGQVQAIEQACDRLLAQTLHTPRAEKLQARYRKHREHLFVFLHQADVPPDNNASERALRNSVVHRKVTGGFRSAWGAKLHAVAMTVMETAKKRKQNVLDALRALFAPLPKPIPASQSP